MLALLPLVAPIAAAVSALTSVLAGFLISNYPEKHTGRRMVYLGLSLCIFGMGLFFAEGTLFLHWKIQQAYDQRLSISRFRLSQVAQAFEAYRQEMGSYPEISGIFLTRDLLQPKYTLALPTLDGFDGAISVLSRPEGFVASASPPPPPGSGIAPPPIVTESGFQPAPAPPPPPPLPTDEAPFPGVTSSSIQEPTASVPPSPRGAENPPGDKRPRGSSPPP